MQRGLKWLTVGLVAGGLLLTSGWGVPRVAAQAPDAEIQAGIDAEVPAESDAEIQAKIAEIQAGIDTPYETVVDHTFNVS